MRVDFAIPAYNEVPIIAESVRVVREALASIPGVEGRVLVVDNASTDGTGEVVRALGHPDVLVIDVGVKGKGAAIVAAAQNSDAELFGFVDADLSADPIHATSLIAALSSGAHIAIGSRLHPDAKIDRSFLRTLSSRAFNALRQLMVGIRVRDSQCGIKFTNREGLKHLRLCEETGWFFEIEWLARAERAGLTIAELPISWQEFRYPGRKSKLRVVRDGIAAVAAFLRIRNRLRKTYG
ncbi:MAG: glycosyltransferase [Minisyncoccia bacterium]